mgnify:CR=1 FL=1
MIYISSELEMILREQNLLSPEALFAFFQDGEVISASSTSYLWKKTLGKEVVYAKKYEYPLSLRYFCRKSRGMREFLAYRFFQAYQIPSPALLYFAEKRILGNLRWSFLITKGMENTTDLFTYFEQNQGDKEARQKILEKLAKIAWRMHSLGFFHKDFKFRNILLSLSQPDEPELYLIDCPRSIKKENFSSSLALWDLTTLYKHASFLCSPLEWQHFVEIYSKEKNCDPQELAQQVSRKCQKKFGTKPR